MTDPNVNHELVYLLTEELDEYVDERGNYALPYELDRGDLAAWLVARGWRQEKEPEKPATVNNFHFGRANFSGANNVIGRLD